MAMSGSKRRQSRAERRKLLGNTQPPVAKPVIQAVTAPPVAEATPPPPWSKQLDTAELSLLRRARKWDVVGAIVLAIIGVGAGFMIDGRHRFIADILFVCGFGLLMAKLAPWKVANRKFRVALFAASGLACAGVSLGDHRLHREDPIDPNRHARLNVEIHNGFTPEHPNFVDVYFRNIGELPAYEIEEKRKVVSRPGVITFEEIKRIQDGQLALTGWGLPSGYELPRSQSVFLSLPGPSADETSASEDFFKAQQPNGFLYTIMTLKYRDHELKGGEHVVTEYCGFYDRSDFQPYMLEGTGVLYPL